MRIVCVSDTHGLHEELTQIPDGDVFVHAGDFTDTGDRQEVVAFNAFLATLPHKYKLVIAGNHETTFDRAFYAHNWHHFGHAQQYDPLEVRALLTNALYLEDQAVLIDGFLFYGTPWQPAFCNWAFNLPRGDAALVAQWQKIPSQVDMLITHSPPMGQGDQVGESRVGCADLLEQVQSRIQPTCHVFGHVHEGYGVTSDGVTTFVNASSCTHEYEATNPPIIVELLAPRFEHTNATLRYEVLLHEQLRVCSQKPVFEPREVLLDGGADQLPASAAMRLPGCHSHRHKRESKRKSLQDFRVDGTPSALLFESTLKLRPVRAEQTRALRYLFRYGFQTKPDDNGDDDEEAAEREDGTRTHSDLVNAPNDGQVTASGAFARLEAPRPACVVHHMATTVIEELRETAVADVALVVPIMPIVPWPLPPQQPFPPTSERRDTKVLHCQDGSLVEERHETRQPVAVPVLISPEQLSAQQETVTAVEEASSCIMCKYNVPGHVHVGAFSSTDAPPSPPPSPLSPPSPPLSPPSPPLSPPSPPPSPPSPLSPLSPPTAISVSVSVSAQAREEPDVECILCKYKVAGHMHTAAEPPADEVGDEGISISNKSVGVTQGEEEDAEQETRDVESLNEDQALAAGRRRVTMRPVLLSSWF